MFKIGYAIREKIKINISVIAWIDMVTCEEPMKKGFVEISGIVSTWETKGRKENLNNDGSIK